MFGQIDKRNEGIFTRDSETRIVVLDYIQAQFETQRTKTDNAAGYLAGRSDNFVSTLLHDPEDNPETPSG